MRCRKNNKEGAKSRTWQEHNNGRDKGRPRQLKRARWKNDGEEERKTHRQMWVNETDNRKRWSMARMIVFQGSCQIEWRTWVKRDFFSPNGTTLLLTHHLKRRWWLPQGTPGSLEDVLTIHTEWQEAIIITQRQTCPYTFPRVRGWTQDENTLDILGKKNCNALFRMFKNAEYLKLPRHISIVRLIYF